MAQQQLTVQDLFWILGLAAFCLTASQAWHHWPEIARWLTRVGRGIRPPAPAAEPTATLQEVIRRQAAEIAQLRSQLAQAQAQAAQTADRPADRQTDTAESASSALQDIFKTAQLNRTRYSVILFLAYAGWPVGIIRQVIKGDNAAIGDDAAKAEAEIAGLGGPAPKALHPAEDPNSWTKISPTRMVRNSSPTP
jgi:hypothetical protein